MLVHLGCRAAAGRAPIVFLLGEATSARHATGDEATAIGTAFDEAQLFPESEPPDAAQAPCPFDADG